MSDATANVFSQRLWTGKAPGAIGDTPKDIPDITIYQPKSPDGSAIVVCPGGGYHMLAEHEGKPMAQWLNTFGVTGIVLKYRLGPRYQYPAQFLDVSRAIRTARAAKDWKIDPERVGVMGSSAVGHLSATVSTHYDSDDRNVADPIDRQTAKPDIAILLYPVITLEGVSVHTGSRANLLGDKPSQALMDLLSNEKHVTPHTAPTFLFHTVADAGVPVENSMMYAAALRKAGVPFEMHLFQPGPHGVGLATKDPILSAWPKLCEMWLKSHHFGK